LRLQHTITVVPRERADELAGVLAASWSVPLPELIPASAAGVRLELDGSTLSVGLPSSRAGPGDEVVTAVRLPGGRTARLRVSVARPSVAQVIALPVLVAMLIAGGGFFLRRAGAAPAVADRAPRRATPVEPLAVTARMRTPELRPDGVRIGRYQFVSSLGRGGMAEVVLARAEREGGFGKLVAIKVLRHELARDAALVTSFLDEARLAASLNHPNIVTIHDLGRSGDQYYIAMEYLDGADLARLIGMVRARGALVPLPIAIVILRRICDGLHAAHTASGPDGQPLNLVHRDVKAANVLVSRAGAVKIGDFGVAKASHALRRGCSEIGEVKGTPGYMAPENRLGRAVDRRVDVYGVGAIAYELITGQPLYLELLTPTRTADDGTPLMRPISIYRCIPLDVEAAVTRALAVDPANRFGDCAEFESALAALAAQHGLADDKQIGQWVRTELGSAAG
jgi:eukaryotic-like serine/threonine-protein kinase